MKILYICSARFDYLQDLTFSGLVKILGNKNVIDYPWNRKFHLLVKSYPKNLGFSGFSLPHIELNNYKNFDLAILASAKPDALVAFNKILPKLNHLPILFLDGGDDPAIGGDFNKFYVGSLFEECIKKRPFDFIFKREYILSLHEKMKSVYPFPFSFPYNVTIPHVPEKNKKYDVSFWAQQEPAIRAKALQLLEEKYDCMQNGTTLNQNFDTYKRRGRFYLEEIAKCKVVLNFRGGGWDTMRYWEVPAAGSFLISQKPQILIPDNFVEGTHVSWCDDSLDDLLDKIDYYLLHQNEREEMAKKAHEHLLKYHLNTVRAQNLIEIVKKF